MSPQNVAIFSKCVPQFPRRTSSCGNKQRPPKWKSKVWLEPESQPPPPVISGDSGQAEDWGALWWAEGELRSTPLRGWGPGEAGGGPTTGGAPMSLAEVHRWLSLVGRDLQGKRGGSCQLLIPSRSFGASCYRRGCFTFWIVSRDRGLPS